MRLSSQLLSNAATTYVRLGAAFVLGIFTTWYILGAAGTVGFGLIALASASTSPTHALDRAIRFGLVRELAAAIASGEGLRVRRSLNSALRLCGQGTMLLGAATVVLAIAAGRGLFNTPEDLGRLDLALALLILGEGIHAGVRLASSPYLQALFAAQRVGTDNLLMLLGRITYTLSALAIFGWLLPDAPLETQLAGFAATRATVQLTDVALGVWLARRAEPELRRDRSAFDLDEYRQIRHTVWHSSQIAILMNINVQLVAVLINLFFGVTYNGIWQIAVQLSGFARMFSEGLLRGIAPLTTHLQERRRHDAVLDLMQRSVRYQLGTMLPVVAFLLLFIYPLLDLWVGRRLAADERLAGAGIGASEAIWLIATMTTILLATQLLRATFFGIERSLYGLGKIRSYSWFAKWSTPLVTGIAATLLAWLREPVWAPVALLISYLLFYPGVLLAAARREAGLPVAQTLRRSVPRPLVASALLCAVLVPARLAIDRLTLPGLAALGAGAALVYGLLAYALLLEGDERQRLGQVLARGRGLLRGSGDPPGDDGEPL